MPACLRRVSPALLGLAVILSAVPATAQQSIDQFNAVNSENQRHTSVQNQLREQGFQQRQSARTGAIGCQGTAAQSACLNQLGRQTQQQNLNLGAQKLQEQDLNWQNRQTLRQPPFPDILKGTSVRPQP